MRIPFLWLGICLASLLGGLIWIGFDVSDFVEKQGTAKDAWTRIYFVLVTAIDVPVVSLAIGSLFAAAFSWLCPGSRSPGHEQGDQDSDVRDADLPGESIQLSEYAAKK